jgi:hypothetical protein
MIIWLITFKEINASYSVDQMKHINKLCEKIRNYWLLKHVIHKDNIGFKGLFKGRNETYIYIYIFWVVAPWRLVWLYLCFMGLYFLHHQGIEWHTRCSNLEIAWENPRKQSSEYPAWHDVDRWAWEKQWNKVQCDENLPGKRSVWRRGRGQRPWPSWGPLGGCRWLADWGITLMMEAVQTFEALVNSYRSIRPYDAHDSNIHSHRREILKTKLIIIVLQV